jgi:Fic family protein
MNAEDFSEDAPGTLVQIPRPPTPTDLLSLEGEVKRPTHIHAFLPNPLPPVILYSAAMVSALGRATHAIGRLDTKANDLANPMILIRPLRNHEALASSRVEGTRAEFDTLVVFQENHTLPSPNSDVREVANYVEALDYALEQPSDRRLAVYLIRELHRILLEGVRGSHLDPGQIRERQVVIGRSGDRPENASFVPPPPTEVQPLLHDLERYVDSDDDIAPLIRIALVHYQFEAIHPFNDGNGRIGRLIIAILLKKWGLMAQPCLDLSAYVLRRRDEYIRRLQQVSFAGDWSGWIQFMLMGMEEQANDAFRRGELLLALRQRYFNRLRGEVKPDAIEPLVDELFEKQRLTAKRVQTLLDVSAMTAQRTVNRLVDMQVIVEASGKKRDRIFVAPEIIGILDTTRFS